MRNDCLGRSLLGLDPRLIVMPQCSPPPAVASKGPLMFRTAIDEATDDWAQHQAKRFIDCQAKVRRAGVAVHRNASER